MNLERNSPTKYGFEAHEGSWLYASFLSWELNNRGQSDICVECICNCNLIRAKRSRARKAAAAAGAPEVKINAVWLCQGLDRCIFMLQRLREPAPPRHAAQASPFSLLTRHFGLFVIPFSFGEKSNNLQRLREPAPDADGSTGKACYNWETQSLVDFITSKKHHFIWSRKKFVVVC